MSQQPPPMPPEYRQRLIEAREAVRILPLPVREFLDSYVKLSALLEEQAPPQRTAQSIEVGSYDGRVGMRLTFTDGPAEVFLFDAATAATLFHQGLACVEALRQAEAPPDLHPTASASLSDYAQVRLVKSPGEP